MQVLLQIFVLVHVFALLGATFLFRSGLFGLLYRRFRIVLWMQPAYILLTIILGTVRSVSGLRSTPSQMLYTL